MDTRERLHGRLAAATWSDAPTDQRQAAVALVLRLGHEPDVLLMQRAVRQGDRWSGQVSLPGGHVDPDDADAFAAAVRETREELGLDLHAVAEPLGRLSALQARARGRRVPLWITPTVFVQHTPAELVLGDEARAAFRLPLRAVLAGELDAPYTWSGEGRTLELPSWRHGGQVVWGLTHRILSGFLDLVGEDLLTDDPRIGERP